MANLEAAKPSLISRFENGVDSIPERTIDAFERRNYTGRALLAGEIYMGYVVMTHLATTANEFFLNQSDRLAEAELIQTVLGAAVTGALYLADRRFGRRTTTPEGTPQPDQQLIESQASQIASPEVQELSQ